MKLFGLRKRFYIPPIICILIMYILAGISPLIDVKHVYKVCPAFIIYTDVYLDSGSCGAARGIIVLINPKSRDDQTVIDHELIHIQQSYRSLFTDWIFCWLDKEHLAKRECEAYAIQINNVDNIPIWAKMIQEEYSPNAPLENIEEYL